MWLVASNDYYQASSITKPNYTPRVCSDFDIVHMVTFLVSLPVVLLRDFLRKREAQQTVSSFLWTQRLMGLSELWHVVAVIVFPGPVPVVGFFF